MVILHMKMVLKQDADMAAVKEIVAAYEGAKLDEDNYIAYYAAQPNKVGEFADEMHAFKYSVTAHKEVF